MTSLTCGMQKRKQTSEYNNKKSKLIENKLVVTSRKSKVWICTQNLCTHNLWFDIFKKQHLGVVPSAGLSERKGLCACLATPVIYWIDGFDGPDCSSS